MLQVKAKYPFGMANEQELLSYFADIFKSAKSADGAVCIFSDKNHAKNTSYVKASEMAVRGSKEISRHDKRDAMFTFATFKENTCMERTIAKVSNIFAWSIDVDYKRNDLSPLDVLWYILDTVSVPAPNYVEYGHRLRLIYLLEEPLRLIPGKKTPLLNGFSFMQKCMVNIINNAVDWANAESCPVTSFFRVPGSINSKTGDVVNILHVADERWTMQEIFSEWIPNELIDKSGCADMWKSAWKEKKKANKKKWSISSLWQRRMACFENLRNMPDVPREKLCFLYGVSCLQTGKVATSEEAVKQILIFNQGFDIPLPEKEIRSKFRTIRAYSFKEETIADFLGTECGDVFDRKSYDALRYKKRRAEKKECGDTKQQLLYSRRKQVCELLSKNMRTAFVTTALGISMSTLKRDIAYIKKHPAEFENTKLSDTEQKTQITISNNQKCYDEAKSKRSTLFSRYASNYTKYCFSKTECSPLALPSDRTDLRVLLFHRTSIQRSSSDTRFMRTMRAGQPNAHCFKRKAAFPVNKAVAQWLPDG